MQRAPIRLLIVIIGLLGLVAAGTTSTLASPPDKKGKKEKEEKKPKKKDEGPDASVAPFDYIAQADDLSQPTFPETMTEVERLETADGEEVYLEITRPNPDEHPDVDPVPVILEASPYHGTLATRIGDRIFPDPTDADGEPIGLTGYFAPRGYAVVMMDLRGTGRSTGCLDHIADNDATDMEAVIEWLVDREWSNGRVGMTGHSYVGSTPNAAAALRPEGLVTIAPSAGLASMYDHQFNKGVPWLLQWAGPMFAYETLAMERDLPPEAPNANSQTGDNWENAPNPQFGCGWQNSSLAAGSGQVTGQYEAWHAERDWREGAAEAEIPIFMIHGVHDNAARIPSSEWFFGGRFDRPDDKVWIGQWDHGSTNGRCGDPNGARVLHPTCRFQQFQYALHAWFDRHLLERDVETGPSVEAFLNGETPLDVTQVSDPETWDTQVLVDDAWREPDSFLGLFPDATDMSLRFEPPAADASASFASGVNAVLAHAGAGRLTFESEPVEQDTVFLGLPELQLNASVSTSQISHLVTTLFREDEDGSREPINFCGIQPQLRDGVETVAPVIPLQEMELPPQCFTMASWVPAGERLVLEVSTTTPHHATFGTDPNITVFTGPDRTAYDLPLVEDAVLHDDVPLDDRPRTDLPPIVGTPTDFFFHGEVPEAEKAGELLGLTPGPRFDQEEPTGEAPKFQTGGWYGSDEFAGNPLLAYWRAPFEGTIQGDVDVQLFASSPTMTVAGELTVTLFDTSRGGAGAEEQAIGRATVSTAGVGPTPTPVEVTIPNVEHTLSDGRDLVVQVSTRFVDVGYFKVWYDSVELPAGITLPILDDDAS